LTFTTRSANQASDACETIAAPVSTTTSAPESRSARTANGMV